MSDHAHMLHYTYVWSLNLRAVATVCSLNIMYIVIFVRYRYLLHSTATATAPPPLPVCNNIAFTLYVGSSPLVGGHHFCFTFTPNER